MKQFRVAAVVCAVCLYGILLSMHAQHPSLNSPTPVTLESMHDHYRPVLVFAPATTPQLVDQIRILAQASHDLHERDVISVPLLLHEDYKPWGVTFSTADIGRMSAQEQAIARQRFHIRDDEFTVILIGKDGGEKLRSHAPISLDTLRSTIDAMPMRQEEMRTQPHP